MSHYPWVFGLFLLFSSQTIKPGSDTVQYLNNLEDATSESAANRCFGSVEMGVGKRTA